MKNNKIILTAIIAAVAVFFIILLISSAANFPANLLDWFSENFSNDEENGGQYIDIPITEIKITPQDKIVSPHPPLIYVESRFGDYFTSISFPSFEDYKKLVLVPGSLVLDLKKERNLEAYYRNPVTEEIITLDRSLLGILEMTGAKESVSLCGDIFARIILEKKRVPLMISFFLYHDKKDRPTNPYAIACPGMVKLVDLIFKTKPTDNRLALIRACGSFACTYSRYDNITWKLLEDYDGQCRLNVPKNKTTYEGTCECKSKKYK